MSIIEKQDQSTMKKIKNFTIYNTQLGQGSYGSVYQALHNPTNIKVAVKIIKKQELIQNKMQQQIMQEVRVLQQLQHPNILKFFDLSETQNNIYIFTELLPKGTLLDYISKFNRVPEEIAKLIFKQLAQAIRYIHKNNYCHRDLKLENILFDDQLIPKIIDFGFASYIRQGQKLSDACGSTYYISPELLQENNYDAFKNDIYQLGVILYSLISSQFPFYSENEEELKQKILYDEVKFRAGNTSEVKFLISKMLEKDPEKRWDIEQVCNYQWVNASDIEKREDQISYKALYFTKQIYGSEFHVQNILYDLKTNKISQQIQSYNMLKYSMKTSTLEENRYREMLLLKCQ